MIKIENAHLLTKRFGRWPSFHDAEVVSARFERRGEDAPFLECDIHVFETTSDVDANGHYVLKNHTLVSFRFCDIDLDSFRSWNSQNVLSDLQMDATEQNDQLDEEYRPIQVEMPSSYGCEASLKCAAIKILKVEEYSNASQQVVPPDR